MIDSGNGVGVGVGVGGGVMVGVGVGEGETEGGGLNLGPGQPATSMQKQTTKELRRKLLILRQTNRPTLPRFEDESKLLRSLPNRMDGLLVD
jgi:hypothetical protein